MQPAVSFPRYKIVSHVTVPRHRIQGTLCQQQKGKRGPRSVVNGSLNASTVEYAALTSSTAPARPISHNQSRGSKETCRRGTCIFKVHRPYPAYHTQVHSRPGRASLPPWARRHSPRTRGHSPKSQVPSPKSQVPRSQSLQVPKSPSCYEVQRGAARLAAPLSLSHA
jgi:hypothetical protein